MTAGRACVHCSSYACDGRAVTCLGCGATQCFANGLGNGSCSVCLYGILPGWSGADKPCSYKGCIERAAYHHVPGSVKDVCLKCAGRPKLTHYSTEWSPGAGTYSKSTKITLREHVAVRLASPIGARGVRSLPPRAA